MEYCFLPRLWKVQSSHCSLNSVLIQSYFLFFLLSNIQISLRREFPNFQMLTLWVSSFLEIYFRNLETQKICSSHICLFSKLLKDVFYQDEKVNQERLYGTHKTEDLMGRRQRDFPHDWKKGLGCQWRTPDWGRGVGATRRMFPTEREIWNWYLLCFTALTKDLKLF